MDNKLLEIMCNRRSVRKYTGENIPEEMLNDIINAGMIAPRGRNVDSVELVVVKDPATLEALSRCRPHGPGMLAGSNAAIVVLGKPEVTDVWTEDCSIAMTMMHLMASSLGIGSCWVQGRLREAPDGGLAEDVVRSLLCIPENYKLEAILSLGIPAEFPAAKSVDDIRKEAVHIEKF